MRLAFLGSPTAAVPTLQRLIDRGHEVVLVVTQPDRRRGRGNNLIPTPVKQIALDHGLAVTERVDDVIDADVELAVVVAFGKLIRPHVLDAVPMVNAHFSLLPRWRGAAPVERAILAGDTETGVCLMKLDEGLDTGPVYECIATPIEDDEPADALTARLADMASQLVADNLERGLGDPIAQQGDVTYAAKIEPSDLVLDFTHSAEEEARRVRIGRAWTTVNGRRLIVWQARATADGPDPGTLSGTTVGTAEGGLDLLEVQPEGKGRMPADAWARGLGVVKLGG
ncbi:MAG TPA: methionyl-tRNA formyltransferase [Acidimicrobiales bacterium]|nr:methionyl-tRNA formyltransferase [Acidimicrobiales bacterium]